MSVILSPDELQQLTGYRQPGKQLQELLRRGFYRARRSRVTGEVILERPHYDAVCAGATAEPCAGQPPRPKVRPPLLRAVT
jgi:hypothetical protein